MELEQRNRGGEWGRTIGLATETMSLQKVTVDGMLRLLEAVGLEASVKVKDGGAPHFLDSVDPQIVWSAPGLEPGQVDERGQVCER